MSAVGALVGGLAGCGVLLVAAGAAARRSPTPAERIAPYLDGPSAARSSSGTPTLVRLVGPSLREGAAWLDGALGDGAALRRRLDAAGRSDATTTAFRLQQLVWGLVGVGGSASVLALLAARGRLGAAAPALLLVAISGAAGAILCDRSLTRAVARRRDAIRMGLPAVADLLALAVAAGESPVAALDRVARIAHGPLAIECRRACDDTGSGVPFTDALDAMAERVDVPAVRRFVDGVAIAVQRGTPLADVLRAQAGDARADLHRGLLETAGRKEVLMLVPVVFLVLPTVVLVALYPAVSSLSSLTP
ncbi:MAG TPA: type II secretion system F family protein [Candidatus Nanopelagicales bacterium]|nr:type II secretion system F family protein [Candidatus Nanopelagicales bacterium]